MSGALFHPAAVPARARALRLAGLAALALLPVGLAVALAGLALSSRLAAGLAVGVAAGLGAAWVARRQGALGLWLTLLALSIVAGEMSALPLAGQSGRLLWADGVLAVGLALALLRVRGTLAMPRAAFLDLLAAFIAWGALSLLVAGDPLTAIAELKEWVAAWVVAAVALAFARDGRRARFLLALVVAAGTLVALLMARAALTDPRGVVLAVLLKQVDLPWGRTNYLAGLLILALPLALGLLGHARAWPARLGWAAAATALAAGVVLSASKGAVVALAAALAVGLAGGGRPARSAALALAVLTCVAVALFTVGPLERVAAYRLQASALDYSVGERLDLYRLAGDQFARHPFTGIGLNNFSVVSHRLTGVDTVPHNLELGFLAELGLPGLVLALAWVAALVQAAWRARAAARDPRARALALGLWTACLGFVVHNQFESTLYGQQFKMLLVLTAAAAWRLARPAPADVHAATPIAERTT